MLPRALSTDPAALADIWTDIRRVADSLGVPERGVQLITRLRTRLEAVAQRAAQQPHHPRVACLVELDPPAAAGGWISELIALAGGVDALGAPGAWPRSVAPGDLERADPDVIVLAPAGTDLAAALAAARDIVTRPGWQGLRAVREGRVLVASGAGLFGRPGLHVAETLAVIAEMVHPAAFRLEHEGRAWTRLERVSGT